MCVWVRIHEQGWFCKFYWLGYPLLRATRTKRFLLCVFTQTCIYICSCITYLCVCACVCVCIHEQGWFCIFCWLGYPLLRATRMRRVLRSRCADITTPLILQISLIMARWFICVYVYRYVYTQTCIHALTLRGHYDHSNIADISDHGKVVYMCMCI